jgi:hypothetical protein
VRLALSKSAFAMIFFACTTASAKLLEAVFLQVAGCAQHRAGCKILSVFVFSQGGAKEMLWAVATTTTRMCCSLRKIRWLLVSSFTRRVRRL